ncbi:hypothetical protein EZV62_003415 [Acer yangbiense]|uniref:AAA+ ATPase domain-containing protein n=1 Tax=Acer yangbiense TaxID=1000413 RepID=A0A5C7IGM4_9ROSI|nr:hypothetical protein EZV62_003415 [Acer yangbiense]
MVKAFMSDEVMVRASEENIRELFSKAYRTAPSIVFIDEIDAIASKRENLQREMEKRIVTQLMTCMDESHRFVQSNDGDSNSEASDQRPGYVLVIGATNRPDAVDPALRRPGRFDREIVLGVPDENARVEILSVITRNLRVEGSFDLLKIARSTPGFVGAEEYEGPELLNKYVGESELAVQTLFSRARTCSPCILFFDEVDALTTKRGKEGGWVVERLLNQLLIELDGADKRRGVFVIGATNRPDVMDRAVLRPGRFGKLLYVPLPTADERGLILKALARKKPIDANVDLCAVAQMKACESFSGADLSALMNEAAMAAWEEKLTATKSCPLTIKITHFERALSKIIPSVSNQVRLVCGAATKLYVHAYDIAAHHAIELVLRFASSLVYYAR